MSRTVGQKQLVTMMILVTDMHLTEMVVMVASLSPSILRQSMCPESPSVTELVMALESLQCENVRELL